MAGVNEDEPQFDGDNAPAPERPAWPPVSERLVGSESSVVSGHASPASTPSEPEVIPVEQEKLGILGPPVALAEEPMESEPDLRPHSERLLHALLPARVLALGSTAQDRLWGWLGPLLVAVIGGLIRFINLGHPKALVFDETYYVKDAFTLLRLGFDAQWPDDIDDRFAQGDTNLYSPEASYTVHPPVGKWLIALGIRLGGVENPWAWRLMTALVGTIAIFILARAARRIFGSTPLGIIAGGLLAIDGIAIVMSRTALLDNFLMFFALMAFACLVVDREQTRRKLAHLAGQILDSGGIIGVLHPHVGIRWWRLAAGVSLGLALGTKWSGLYFLAAFGLLTAFWDLGARRIIKGRKWGWTWVLNDAVPAMMSLVPVAFGVYLASWFSWFIHPESWGRDWYQTHPGNYPDWLPNAGVWLADAARSFSAYHAQMYEFHTNLSTPHDYQSNPWGWLLMLRPTSFYWQTIESGENGCTASSCVQSVLALGNPLIWWIGSAGLLFMLYRIVRFRDWRAIAISTGIAAGWVPWLFYPERTIFTFYTVAFVPFVVLAVVYLFAVFLEHKDMPVEAGSIAVRPAEMGSTEMAGDEAASGQVAARGTRTKAANYLRRRRWWIIIGVLVAITLLSAFFMPNWTAMQVPWWYWQIQIWFQMWI